MLSISLQCPNAVPADGSSVVFISLRRAVHSPSVLSFSSTLYLEPILGLLLCDVRPDFRYELRLGLQEALVNAARHGNQGDSTKAVQVYFIITPQHYLWIITDEGEGFNCQAKLNEEPLTKEDYLHSECGRGLYILKKIFDEVQWNETGNQLRLCKHMPQGCRPILE